MRYAAAEPPGGAGATDAAGDGCSPDPAHCARSAAPSVAAIAAAPAGGTAHSNTAARGHTAGTAQTPDRTTRIGSGVAVAPSSPALRVLAGLDCDRPLMP